RSQNGFLRDAVDVHFVGVVVDEVQAAAEFVEDNVGGRAAKADDFTEGRLWRLLLRARPFRGDGKQAGDADKKPWGQSIHRPILLKGRRSNLTLKPVLDGKVSGLSGRPGSKLSSPE